MELKIKSSLTRSIQFGISILFGFTLWKISSNEHENGVPKVVLSPVGVLTTMINFLILIFSNIYDYLYTPDDTDIEQESLVINICLFIHDKFLTLLPLVLLVTVWTQSWNCKRSLQQTLQARKGLAGIGVDVENVPWTFQAQAYGTIIAYAVLAVLKMIYHNCVKGNLHVTSAQQSDIYDTHFWLFLTFTFATVFNLVSALAFVALRFNMINAKLCSLNPKTNDL